MPAAPSWDLAIVVFFLIGIAFGYILQREKIVATLVSVYISLVVTQIITGNVLSFFQGDKVLFNKIWISSGSSPFTVKVVIFMLIIMLISAKGGISSSKGKGILAPIEIMAYSFLATALILSSIFYFMPPESRDAFMASSKMASFVIKNYLWWIVLPPIAMIGMGFFRKGSSSSD